MVRTGWLSGDASTSLATRAPGRRAPDRRTFVPRRRLNSPATRALSGAALFVALWLSSACSDAEGDGAADDDTTPRPPAPLGIVFAPGGTLTLSPGEEVEFGVISSPPAERRITFGLLASDPAEFHDASLTPTQTTSDAEGKARVTLRATSVAATFLVRASLEDGTETRRAVSVSAEGYGSVSITPKYAGARELGAWTASARAGVSCVNLVSLLDDGPLVDTGKAPLLVESIPVGPDIAVIVRAGQLAAGCLTVPRLEPDERRKLEVLVTDLPLQLDRGSQQLAFGIESSTPEFSAELAAAIADMMAAFADAHPDDAELLLADWAAGIKDDDDRQAFEQNALDNDFRALVLGELPGPKALRGRVRELLQTASLTLVDARTFEGLLTFGPKKATFALQFAAGVPAAQSGFFTESSWSRSLEPGDVLVLGGALEYQSSRFLTAIVDHTAREDESPAPPEELAALADCTSIAAKLADASGGSVHDGCDEACALLACQSALDRAWTRAADQSTTLSRLAVAMSGAAEHTDQAEILSFEGTWLGTTKQAAQLSGPARGHMPE